MALTFLPTATRLLRGAGGYFDWSPQADSLLQVYWYQRTPDGREWTTAEIGEKLGCNKNQVIGRARRLRLQPRQSPIRVDERREGRWPKEKVAAFVRQWTDRSLGRPLRFDEIATTLNITPAAVREAARRMALLNPEELAVRGMPRPVSTLPPLASSVAREEAETGASPAAPAPAAPAPAAAPGDAPGRAPVDPAIVRRGPFRVGGAVQARARGDGPQDDRTWRVGRRLAPVAPTAADAAPAPRPAPTVIPSAGGRTCCWPLWGHRDRPTHRYCGDPIDATHGLTEPYCAEHRAIAWVRPRRPAAAHEAAA